MFRKAILITGLAALAGCSGSGNLDSQTKDAILAPAATSAQDLSLKEGSIIVFTKTLEKRDVSIRIAQASHIIPGEDPGPINGGRAPTPDQKIIDAECNVMLNSDVVKKENIRYVSDGEYSHFFTIPRGQKYVIGKVELREMGADFSLLNPADRTPANFGIDCMYSGPKQFRTANDEERIKILEEFLIGEKAPIASAK